MIQLNLVLVVHSVMPLPATTLTLQLGLHHGHDAARGKPLTLDKRRAERIASSLNLTHLTQIHPQTATMVARPECFEKVRTTCIYFCGEFVGKRSLADA